MATRCVHPAGEATAHDQRGQKKHRTSRKKSRREHISGNYCRLNTSCMERQLASVQTGEEHGASDIRRRHLPTRSTIHCDDNGPHSDVTHRNLPHKPSPLLPSPNDGWTQHTHTAPVWHSRQTERALHDVLSASTQNGLVGCRPLDLAQIPCCPVNGPSCLVNCGRWCGLPFGLRGFHHTPNATIPKETLFFAAPVI